MRSLGISALQGGEVQALAVKWPPALARALSSGTLVMRPPRKAPAPRYRQEVHRAVDTHSIRGRSRVTGNPEAIDGQLIVGEASARLDGTKHQYPSTYESSNDEVASFNNSHCIRSGARNSL